MKTIFLALITLFFYSPYTYADCIFGLNDIKKLEQYNDALRCLQDDIDSIKMQSAHNSDGKSKRYFTIQVRGTHSLEEAMKYEEIFENYGYEAYVSPVKEKPKAEDVSDRPYYRVMVGKFITRADVDKEKKEIKLKYPKYMDIFVTTILETQ